MDLFLAGYAAIALFFPVYVILWLRARKAKRKLEEEFKSTTTELDKKKTECEKLRKNLYRFDGIADVEERIKELEAEEGQLKKDIEKKRQQQIGDLLDEEASLRRQISDLRTSYAEKRSLSQKLRKQLAEYQENLDLVEQGLYEPHFDFGDSEEFKEEIKSIRSKQKAMVTAKIAALCPIDWTVDGSKSKGKTMINRQMRLTLRAFNNECEAAIANTRWNNANAMERRITNSAKAISKENASMSLTISDRYIQLKLDELRCTHEYREKRKDEKDKRAEIARAEREEKRLIAEAKAAEKEEKEYQALLDKAREEAGTGDLSAEMEQKIKELEAALDAAHSNTERARAMAEMTKSGYVYVISNIGSFGEDIVKIGLTRRLDPNDRVKELGDASVPFLFDTHAMIYSDEAPKLEAALHTKFSEQRVNMSNMRKEFFRVSLDDVEKAVTELAPDATFFKDIEAQEWHETLAKRNQRLEIASSSQLEDELPDSI